MSCCFYSGNPEKREVSLGMSLLTLGPAVWPKSLDLHPRSLQGAQLQPSNRWCNELWATCGAAETWGPLAPRLGPLNNARFSLPPPVLSHQELLSVSLCHLPYYHLKAL